MSILSNSFFGPVLGFLLALIPLIILHEIGHFVMARLTGVWAKEFGIGYPPRITKLFQWRETEFTLNWLPLGGFVRMEGEEIFREEETDPEEEKTPAQLAKEEEARQHSLYAKPVGTRILISLGGPLMNLVTAWVFAVVLFLTGIPGMNVSITEIAPNSPAAEAGLQVGDKIVAIDGQEVEAPTDVQVYSQENPGTPIEMTLEREEEMLKVSLTPRVDPPEGEGAMGIAIYGEEKPGSIKRYPIGQAVTYGTRYLAMMAGTTIILPIWIIRGMIPLEQARPVGVVGISQIAQRSVEDSITVGAPYPFMNILILLSISLGIFNLLPIPALDGGRILFAVIEKIRRKPLTPEVEERIHMVAFALLLILFLFITVLDIVAPVPIP